MPVLYKRGKGSSVAALQTKNDENDENGDNENENDSHLGTDNPFPHHHLDIFQGKEIPGFV